MFTDFSKFCRQLWISYLILISVRCCFFSVVHYFNWQNTWNMRWMESIFSFIRRNCYEKSGFILWYSKIQMKYLQDILQFSCNVYIIGYYWYYAETEIPIEKKIAINSYLGMRSSRFPWQRVFFSLSYSKTFDTIFRHVPLCFNNWFHK